jgi:hypothetical protein
MTNHPDFGDSDARHILARAAEIDAQQGQKLDAVALREIAAEAGISPAAVDQAIHERLQPVAPKRAWAVRHRGLLITIGIATAVFLARLFQ